MKIVVMQPFTWKSVVVFPGHAFFDAEAVAVLSDDELAAKCVRVDDSQPDAPAPQAQPSAKDAEAKKNAPVETVHPEDKGE